MALNAFDAAETITLDLSSLEFMDASRLRVAFEPSSSGLRVVFEANQRARACSASLGSENT
jgi:hypothetical protein